MMVLEDALAGAAATATAAAVVSTMQTDSTLDTLFILKTFLCVFSKLLCPLILDSFLFYLI